MTTGVVDIKIFGPPVASADIPTAGLKVGPGNNPIGVNPIVGKPTGSKPWPMTLLDGVYRPAGPNGLPLLVPPGCEANGYRELLVHERDHNWISQYLQFLMFTGVVNTSLQFYDGTNYYAAYDTLSMYNMLSPGGFYILGTPVSIPSGEVSNITIPADGVVIFVNTGSQNIIPNSPVIFTVSTYSITYGQNFFSLTTSLTSAGSSFNVAQVGFLPASYSSNDNLNVLANNAFTAPYTTSYTPPGPIAVYTSYQLSQVYTVPANGAITIEYGISATL